MCVSGVEGVVVVVVCGSVWTSCAVRSSLAGGGCCLGCLLKSIILFVRKYQILLGLVGMGSSGTSGWEEEGVGWDLERTRSG